MYCTKVYSNADSVPVSHRYKFEDDLSTLEKINLLSVGLASHNVRLQVPSSPHGQLIPKENLKTQTYIDSISKWTSNQKMVLNEEKNQGNDSKLY